MAKPRIHNVGFPLVSDLQGPQLQVQEARVAESDIIDACLHSISSLVFVPGTSYHVVSPRLGQVEFQKLRSLEMVV